MDTIDVYTDGSYAGGQCAWAFVAVDENGIVAQHARRMDDMPADLASQRNVAAEMKAAMMGVSWANQNGYRPIIHHDYVGIEKWVTGEWGCGTAYSRQYRRYMRDADIEGFESVTAHSGNRFNEIADRMSRSAALDAST